MGDEVVTKYDRCWGRLRKDIMTDLISSCTTLCQKQSVLELLPFVLPGTRGRDTLEELIVEFILWAERQAWWYSTGVIPTESWPDLHGNRPLLRKWQTAQSWRQSGSKSQKTRQPRQHHQTCRRTYRHQRHEVMERHSEEEWTQHRQQQQHHQHRPHSYYYHQTQQVAGEQLQTLMQAQGVQPRDQLHWMFWQHFHHQHQMPYMQYPSYQ